MRPPRRVTRPPREEVTPASPTPPTVTTPTPPTLIELGLGPGTINTVITDVEKRLLERGQLSEVEVTSPSVTLEMSLDRVKELEDFLVKMSPVGVKKLELNVTISLSDMNGKELLEWLRKIPSKAQNVSVRGGVKQ